ncbi:unnamed protein product [Ostreobium quekettii]|uniref:Protein kinase domain-containing protein n=1 Tax=Ostreobium quekettii TaxID=121088 RepID=A0A8S1JF77_9CHLO|nr:unnamed protein product [Ostreobium quekettii]
MMVPGARKILSHPFATIVNVDYELPRRQLSPALYDMINRMLEYDPKIRISMQEIKNHVWFREDIPKGMLEMNQHPQRVQHGQDFETIRAVLLEGHKELELDYDDAIDKDLMLIEAEMD